ncbi:MAG: rhodanese-like domain-containing protein [Proteobacteria bacterium]|nr:rhodanese-like domain-containing protein [Pseudomonadota bacterium]
MPLLARTLREISQILVLAILFALGVNAMSPRGIALMGQWDVSEGLVRAGAKNEVMTHDREITRVQDAYALFQTGSVLFVDARDETLYSEGHIKGAESLPVYDYDAHFENFIARHPRMDQTLITYCSGRECEDSHTLATYLTDDGYTKVVIFIDGYPAWQKEGFPVEYGH